MKSKFTFDKKTGTMVPANDAIKQAVENKVEQDVVETPKSPDQAPPKFQEEQKLEFKATPNASQTPIVQMKRVDQITAVQLINDKGIPEAYLDSTNTGVMMFRQMDDYDICQIADERTGKVLCYIGGYALQFNFNMAELRTMERIEQCLQGIVKLFRHKLMNQNLDGGPNSQQ